ncbi:MAG: sulfite exporter TauE/SafE family protein, partial [Acidobacteriaceae bacterium]|nr:sulfite exporter TauE/SafE family protein [Acidobacteriaceae bacterium]
DRAMQIPFKVSTGTSNFMIGVTAAASATLYLSRGYVNPAIAMPVLLGVLAGSLIGARFLPRLSVMLLRRVFAVLVGIIALEMIFNGIAGRI